MRRFAGFRRVLDGIGPFNTSASATSNDSESDVNDRLEAQAFTLSKVGRYGFPYHATCLALDPVQKLLAIGTASGSIRICGKPGVECHVHHESNASVRLLLFLINEGGLISVCDDASLHLWNLRQKQPALIQSLRFNKEKVTAIHNPFPSKWLYVGTERGKVHMVNIEQFAISGYEINWNHVIPVTQKTHPGPVLHIATNPQDHNKLLLSYETGVCVCWDLKAKKVCYSYQMDQNTQYMTCTAWSMDGKQFMAGHWDGSLSTWNFKNCKKPEEISMPHGGGKANASNSTGKDGVCCSVTKLEWHATKPGEPPLVVFSGGMAYGNNRRGITLMRGRSKNLLLTDVVVDFQCLVASPYPTDIQPTALFVLLRNEIVVFDLMAPSTPSIPWFTLPYTFDIHESPVTCLQFYPECPSILLASLHALQSFSKQEQAENSRRQWPLAGGQDGEMSQDPCLVVTGHADGTVKFWDATSNMLIPCCKISVSKLFERDMSRPASMTSNLSKRTSVEHYDDPFAIQHIQLCALGRVLAVACASYFVVVFTFHTKENSVEVPQVEVSFAIEVAQECDSPSSDSLSSGFTDVGTSPVDNGPGVSASKSMPSLVYHPPLRTGTMKWSAGFQPEFLCQQLGNEPAPNITSLALSSAYGLVAFGNTIGVALIDYIQKKCVMVLMNYELGVPGDWTDSGSAPTSARITGTPSKNAGPPIFPTPAALEVNGTELKVEVDVKREGSFKLGALPERKKAARMFSLTEHHGHSKLGKRVSNASSTGSLNGKDKEDGFLGRDKDFATAGSVLALQFAYTYTRKGGTNVSPSLWIGTSAGTSSVLALSLPPSGEERLKQAVLVFNSGLQIDNHHCLLNITHLDRSGNILAPPFDMWRDTESKKASDVPQNMIQNIQNFSSECSVRHYVVLTTEKQIRVRLLPNLRTFASTDPVDAGSFIIKADSMTVSDGNCIGCLTSNGHLMVYTLPTLRLLLDVECGTSLADYRMIRTFTMGRGGEAVYLASPTEIQRIAFTIEKEDAFVDGIGCLFTWCAPPEPPQKGFLQSIFASPSPLDREELFGPKSGAQSRSLAERVPGPGSESLRASADSAGGAISRAKMALIERGEKLSQLEDKTAEMNARASAFSSAAQALADKYQRKKWYQL